MPCFSKSTGPSSYESQKQYPKSFCLIGFIHNEPPLVSNRSTAAQSHSPLAFSLRPLRPLREASFSLLSVRPLVEASLLVKHNRDDQDRQNVSNLNHRINCRPSGIFVRIAYRITGYRRLMSG